MNVLLDKDFQDKDLPLLAISLLVLSVFFIQNFSFTKSFSNKNQNIESSSPAYRIVIGSKIDLNKALTNDLTLVPGIGYKTARRIMEYKTINGPFNSATDLEKVGGIGQGNAQKFSEFLFVAVDSGNTVEARDDGK